MKINIKVKQKSKNRNYKYTIWSQTRDRYDNEKKPSASHEKPLNVSTHLIFKFLRIINGKSD